MGGLDQEGKNMRQIKHADSFAVVNPWEIREQLKAPSNMDMEIKLCFLRCLIMQKHLVLEYPVSGGDRVNVAHFEDN